MNIYDTEVRERWGEEAYKRSTQWWKNLSKRGQKAFLEEALFLQEEWIRLFDKGTSANSVLAQRLAGRHYDWVTYGWGNKQPEYAEFVGLAELYASDMRFAANYGGLDNACFVRDALVVFAQRELEQ